MGEIFVKGVTSVQKDMFYYYNQLINKIQRQEEKIRELIDQQAVFQQEMEKLKNEPSINIERIDYQFDQLKIERLEGTLNIGINPNDLEDLDEFSIGYPQFPPPTSQFRNKPFIEKLEKRLNDYLEQELPTLIDKTLEQLKVNVDASYNDFIQQDIRRQLPSRISYYLQRFATKEDSSDDHLEEQIFTTIKTDIEKGRPYFF